MPGDLFGAVEAAATLDEGRIALVGAGGEGSRYSYHEVMQLARRLAARLLQPPFVDLPDIGLLAANRPEWPIAYLGILASGKTVVPFDAMLKPEEHRRLVGLANLRAMITTPSFAETLTGLDRPPDCILFDDSNSGQPWTPDWPEPIVSRPSPAPIAVLIYTSGTTGAPKGVELTPDNLLSNLEGIRPALEVRNSDIFLSVLPLHHTFEAMAGFLVPLTSGAQVIYARTLKSRELLEDIRSNGVTVMSAVPLLYEKMYQAFRRKLDSAPALRRALFAMLYQTSRLTWRANRQISKTLFRSVREKAGLASVRMFVSGGAPIPAQVAEFFNMIGIDFLQGYGMTECSPVISVNRLDSIGFGSVGPPLPNLYVDIVEPGTDGIGEITVSGPSITPGYRNNPEATAQLIRDGRLHTGDLGRIGSDGHLWIMGRAKNVILTAAGKNIYPEELEEVILMQEEVAECVVVGRSREGKSGEEPVAIIVPDQEVLNLNENDLPDIATLRQRLEPVFATINEQLADYKRLAAFDLQYEPLEKTSTRKVKRFLYESRYQA